MSETKRLYPGTWRAEFDKLLGKKVLGISVLGWGNGCDISFVDTRIEEIEYLNETGVEVSLDNGVTIQCGECTVRYE